MLPGCSSTFSDCSQAAARQLPSCCTEVSDTCRKPLGEAGSRHGAWGRRRHGASARYRHGASGRRGLRPSCLGDALGRHRGSTVRRRATHAAMRCATRLPGRSATLFAGQPPINFACSTINCKADTVASASGCSFPRFPRTAWGHRGWASAVCYGFRSHCGPSQVVRALTSNHDAEHVVVAPALPRRQVVPREYASRISIHQRRTAQTTYNIHQTSRSPPVHAQAQFQEKIDPNTANLSDLRS